MRVGRCFSPRTDSTYPIPKAWPLALLCLIAGLVLCDGRQRVALAQDESSNAEQQSQSEYSEEEQRQIQLAERFLSILLKNPRRGTALDRVYGHHIEFGTTDSFIESLRNELTAAPQDGAKWMLLGLFESQRGADGAAAEALRKAEQIRPEDALAPYYLSQSLLRIGENNEAVEAMERALEREPARADLLEIFQQLGRVHQRAQRTDEALRVWQRLETLFPDDPRVLEQIAVILAEEGQPALALERYEKLAEIVRDDYRKTTYRVAAAELKIKTGNREQGIANLESVLADLNPDGWLYRDVRRRIEDVFLRSSDQDSLVKYYERWLAGHPEDVEAMARLARFLSASARVPEATQWMQKALKLAPSRTDLRKSFIDQLVDEQKYAEAGQQYELLCEAEPGNPDFLRDWGKLVLRDKSQPIDQRRAAATRIWNRILQSRPTDALACAQVADLYRSAEMNDAAMELYKKAVSLAPAEPQYREYLGEFYHIQKHADEALKTWASIAAPPNRSAENLARVAEVYNSFGYFDAAVEAIAAACELDPKDFALQIQAAEYHSRSGNHDAALGFVAAAEPLASNDDQRSTIVEQRISIYQSSQRLGDVIEQLTAELKAQENPTPDDWHLLARYLEAHRQWAEASEAIGRALQIDADSIPALTTAARIAEASGDFGGAADLNRQLAEADRRSRDDHLMNVARLEMQLGRADEALQAANELIVASPGNTDNYEFFAQLCFRLGRNEEGLEALRKAVRINPNEPHLMMALGAALAGQLQTREAIEVYWRAFDKSEEVEDKVSLTMKLVPLYEQINQFDQLVERLERDRQEEDKRREMTICLAQAYQSANDFGTARRELESLLSEDTRDTNLLQQLAKLCQSSGDLEGAVSYQRQLVSIAPGHETEYPLANMLEEFGNREEARDIFVKLTRREEDPARLLRSLDSLLTQDSHEAVIEIVEPLLSQQRDDWELLYREAVAWASLEKQEEAEQRFRRLLAIPGPHDALGTAAEARLKQAQQKARSENLRGLRSTLPTRQSPLTMLSRSRQVQQATGLVAQENYYGGSTTQPVWMPEAFGVARMAAYGWLLRFEQEAQRDATINESAKPAAQSDSGPAGVDAAESESDVPSDVPSEPSIAESVAEEANAAEASRESLYDWMYVATLLGNNQAIFELSRRMAVEGGNEEQQFFLSSLQLRGIASTASTSSVSGEVVNQKEPLSDEDIELMLRCYHQLNDNAVDEQASAAFGTQVAYGSNGQVYVLVGGSYVPVSGAFSGGNMFISVVMEELRLAGRGQQAQELLDAQLDKADSARDLSSILALLMAEKQMERMPDVFDRWRQRAEQEIREAPVTSPKSPSSRSAASSNPLAATVQTVMRWMGALAPEEEHQQILSILDQCLNIAVAEIQHDVAVRAAAAPRSQRMQTQNYERSVQAYYGDESNYVRFQFNGPGEYVNSSALTMIRQVFESFKRNEVLEDLLSHLRSRAADASVQDRPYEQLMLAAALAWNDEQEESVELISAASESFADDPALRFQLANLYMQQGDLDRALELVDTVVARDQQLLQQRELMAIQIAERLGEVERARQAAERLFGLRLNSQTQLSLIDPMRRLGLHAMADAVMARAERASGNQPTALASLMMLYQGQGKTDDAKQLAHVLMRRTTSPIAALATAARNPSRYSSGDSGIRTQALRLLQQTSELKAMIEQAENQLQRSPNSLRICELLVEYYEASNQREKVGPALVKALEVRPTATGLRLKLAEHYEQTGKHDQACDVYLAVLKDKPAWIAEDLHRVRNVFTRTKRTRDLAEALCEVDLKQVSQPYYIIDLTSSMLQEDPHSDVALRLVEMVFDAYPSYRGNLMRNFFNSGDDKSLWNNERIYSIVKKSVIPTALQIKADPWSGISDIYSYSNDGEVSSTFHRLLTAMTGSEVMKDLVTSIGSAVEANPDWLGGKAMLALAEISADRKEAGKVQLVELIQHDEVMEKMPADACWIVGQELEKFEDSRPLALKLFEQALQDPERSQSTQLQYSPVSKLIKLYETSGRKEDARNLINAQLKNSGDRNYDQSYEAYRLVENTSWAAERLLALGYPVDAVQLHQNLLVDPEALTVAAGWNSRDSDYYVVRSREGLRKAMEALEAGDAEQAKAAIGQLLTVDESSRGADSLLNLMLSTPQTAQLGTTVTASALIDLLVTLSSDPGKASVLDQRLTELRDQHPEDLSIAVALAHFRQKTNHSAAGEAVRGLSELVASTLLDPIAEGRRPNSRQRREAALAVPLWLVARETISTPLWDSHGEALATRALEGARRQVQRDQAVAILFEWGSRLLDTEHRQAAEERWTAILEMATERPSRRAEARENADDAAQAEEPGKVPDEVTPPLTISQFRLAMRVADTAAEHGMAALSQHALAESLRGGMPVSDPAALASSASTANPFASSSSSASTPASSSDAEVAKAVEQVVNKWGGKEYAEKSVYQLLKSLVMPAQRPQEIFLYPNSEQLAQARVSSLGALLVHWAGVAARLEELDAEVQIRAQGPQARIPGLVLRTLKAIAADDISQSQEHLQQLQAALEQDGSTRMIEMACHAALPASDNPETEAVAMTILQRALTDAAQSPAANQNSSGETSAKLAEKVNRYLALHGGADAVRQYYESLLLARQADYARYSGDYGLYLQNRDLARFADEAGRNALPLVALDFLGRVADFDVGDYSRPATPIALAFIVDHTRSLPADQRYQLWADWTLPNESRNRVRMVTELVQPSVASGAFATTQLDLATPLDSQILSNFTELVRAATEAGKLDDLRQRAVAATRDSIPGANYLQTLTVIASSRPQQAEAFVDGFFQQMYLPKETQPPRAERHFAWGDILTFYACLEAGLYFAESSERFDHFERYLRGHAFSSHRAPVRAAYAKAIAAAGGAEMDFGDASNLQHWFATELGKPGTDQLASWWVTRGDSITHILGSGRDSMSFAYPVTGDFEFTVDCYNGDWGESDAGYGGVIVESQQYGSATTIATVSGHESLSRPGSLTAGRPGYGEVRIVSKDGKLRYFLNGYLIYEEALSGTYPWISLQTDGNRTSAFRNPHFTGTPTVPERVALFAGNRMDGWSTGFPGETQPRHRLMAETPENENSTVAYYQQQEPAQFDWETEDGVLTGTANKALADAQRWLYYQRPLREGESFQYQFYYIPRQSAVTPTVGQMAFLLEPDGVKTRWISSTDFETVTAGIESSGAVIEKEFQRSNSISLLAGQWNRVDVSIRDGQLSISLNDQLVYQRPSDDLSDHRFGLLRSQDQSARVKDAFLTGDWPEQIGVDVGDNLVAVSEQLPTAQGHLAELFIRRSVESVLADDVLRRAREMDEAEGLAYLAEWVLPGDDHRRIRLEFAYASFADQRQMSPRSAGLDRVQSPAWEMVRLAKRLGQLDAIRQRIKEAKPTNPVDLRNQQALLTLAMIEAGDTAGARDNIGALQLGLQGGLPKHLEADERAAELMVALAAGNDPQLWPVGLDLAKRIRELERNGNTSSSNGDWQKLVNGAIGAIELLHSHDSYGNDSLTQWTAVPYLHPQGRSSGYRPSTWMYHRGALSHMPGETWSQLFFQSPMRGKYEITARLSTHGHTEVALATGMHAAEPKYDLKATRIIKVMHNTRDIEGVVSLPVWDETADFHIAVDNNEVTTSVNGVQIHKESFSAPLDPWMILQSHVPGNFASVRNLRVHGSPEIPEEIDLIHLAGWVAWRADMYGDWFSETPNPSVPYVREGDEIHGQKRTNRAASPTESLLMYSRPMLEDGEVEFETFYVPGEFEVHPALGEDAFLLDAEGVALHQLTDAQWEKSGLAVDNRSELSGGVGDLALKPNAWNHVRLTLVGDQVSVFVNGSQVAEKTNQQPANERFFGLFRYSDKTQCRVRNLKYRGDWPKTLPPIADQQLAYLPEGASGLAADRIADEATVSLARSIADLRSAGLRTLGPPERMTAGDEGTRFELRGAGNWSNWPGLQLTSQIAGDAEMTLDYADLQMKAAKQGWGVALCFEVGLEDSHNTVVETAVAINGQGVHETRCSLRRDMPRGNAQTLEVEKVTGNNPTGRLRLVRRGGRIDCLAAGGPQEPFQLIHSFTVGDAKIRRISVQAKGSDDVCQLTGTASALTLKIASADGSGSAGATGSEKE